MESTILYYSGYHGCKSKCRLSIYKRDEGDAIVVASEMEDNTGTSVTNMIEVIASMVARQLKDSNFLLVEHYPPNKHLQRRHETGDWSIVTFAKAGFLKPQWTHTTPEQLLEYYDVDVLA